MRTKNDPLWIEKFKRMMKDQVDDKMSRTTTTIKKKIKKCKKKPACRRKVMKLLKEKA